MASIQRTIFVDVTQLVHWSGRLTGIPKVMDELAVRFAEQPNAKFVSWVKDRRALCEVDFKQTRLQGSIVYAGSGEATTPAAVAITTPSLSLHVRQFVKAGARRLLRVNGRVSGYVEAWYRKQFASSRVPAKIQAGDILVIPWGEWWDQAFTDYVVAQENAGVHVVQIIHDIATTTQPQFFEQVAASPTTYNAAVLPHASLVLAVSLNTKRELEAWLKAGKLQVPKIEVIRNGDDIAVPKPEQPTDKQFTASKLADKDYLMTVGTIEAKKNHALLYYVYKLALERGISLPKVVIVGRHGWGTDNIYGIMTHDPTVKDQFIFLHNTSDAELAWLYDHCLFTLQPSFHEGWGIPIAQSVARGIPCLCSNTSSMVEIAEGIVEHFSPFSTDECLAAIQHWLRPKALAAARERTRHYQQITWGDTFKQVQAYIKEL